MTALGPNTGQATSDADLDSASTDGAAGLVTTATLAMAQRLPMPGTPRNTRHPTDWCRVLLRKRRLTVTGGVVDETSRFAAGGDGMLHIIYTITPHQVTAEDARGTSYWITAPLTRRRSSSATNCAS
jgi:hypothetical protein